MTPIRMLLDARCNKHLILIKLDMMIKKKNWHHFNVFFLIVYLFIFFKEKFEDTKGVTRSSELKDRQHNETKGQTIIYKTLHRKLTTPEQHKLQ